jgi:hypothetical protein
LPEDFKLTPERRRFAEVAGLDAVGEFGKFRDKKLSEGTLHEDWEAAWRYWCRNALEIRERQDRRRG